MIICLILIGVKLSMPPIYWIVLSIALLVRAYERWRADNG